MLRKNMNTFPKDSEALIGERKDSKYSVHSISLKIAFSAIACIFFSYSAIRQVDFVLPLPLMNRDIGKYPNRFIAERASLDLKHLVSIGPKVTGSYENEVLAVDFLRREINYIIQQSNRKQTIELDLQKVSGSYFIDFKPKGYVQVYKNVQNIVVKLHGSEQGTQHDLLINCHFDTVHGSPGASDDGINCAVMLEVLRVLSRMSERLKHSVVFLFNGAEESCLLASHGFITQHKWSNDIAAFINLEAAGSGGREIVFQAGPEHPWLIRHYAKSAPHPFAQASGEEIFQMGLIPSDTDFRIFRDFANIPGIDMAHIFNGYVYHTKYDNFENIPLGTYQHTGDNVLALVKSIANGVELSNTKIHANGKVVFYDILGLFIVHYTEATAAIINYSVSLASIIIIILTIKSIGSGLSRNHFYEVLRGTLAAFLGLIASLCTVMLIAVSLDNLDRSLFWYTNSMFIPAVYWIPTILCQIVVILAIDGMLTQKGSLSIALRVQLRSHGVSLFWAIITAGLTFAGIRTAYYPMLILLFATVANFIILALKLQNSVKTWLIPFIICQIMTMVFCFYASHIILMVFVPISGRMGPSKNPDILIAAVSASFCYMTTCFLAPLILLVRKPLIFNITLALFCLGSIFLVVATIIGFPYRGDVLSPTPQRFYAFQTERNFYNSTSLSRKRDSGYFVLNSDRRAPKSVEHIVTSMQNAYVFCDDASEIFCGLPLYSPRLAGFSKYSSWVPGPPPVIHQPVQLTFNGMREVENLKIKMIFSLSGPSHMGLTLVPVKGVELVDWSFLNEVTKPGIPWDDRDTYFVNIVQGLETETVEFYVTLKVLNTWKTGDRLLDLAAAGHYFEPSTKSPAFVEFVNSFPDWAYVAASAASYKSWQF